MKSAGSVIADEKVRALYEPTPVGLCVQSNLVINKISNLQILKY
jgi:hypothetical protein